MTGSRRQAALKGYRTAHNGEQGFTLIEMIIAMGILAAVSVTFLLGMSTSSRAVMVSQERVDVESLAKSQLEYVKSSAYDEVHDPPLYGIAPSLDIPQGYTVVPNAERMDPKGDGTGNDDGIQKITVTINHDGETAFTLVGYKVR